MLSRRIVKIVIVGNKLYSNTQLTQYVTSLCDKSAYPNFEFEIKSYLSGNEAILALEDDLNIMILDYFINDAPEEDHVSGHTVLAEVNLHCENCFTIVTSDAENSENIKTILAQNIYEFVDRKVNSDNRIGAIIQEILTKIEPDK